MLEKLRRREPEGSLPRLVRLLLAFRLMAARLIAARRIVAAAFRLCVGASHQREHQDKARQGGTDFFHF
jgi:hypothetical protein